MDVHAVSQNVVVWLTAFGFKVLGALGFWIVGRWLIHVVLSFVARGLRSQNVDPTLQAYLASIITNRMIREAFGEAGYPAPEQRLAMRSLAAG